jgi:membrane protease YdiL (CAAX protease family)
MLLPAFFIEPLPVSLLSFPDKISIDQAITFLISFGLIGFFPWKKFGGGSLKKDGDSSQTIPAIFYAFLRIVFLTVYEWFFRGLLLIGISAWAGIEWSIVINILLYAIMHSHKSKKEMIGCIPLGLLLCVFTIWWQSIWPAIILHLEIAIMNEWPPLQQIISPQKQTAL